MKDLEQRLLWESPTAGDRGAFALRGGPLHLAVLAGGRLDRLAGESGARPGLTVEPAPGGLRLTARGGCTLLLESGPAESLDWRGEPVRLRAPDGNELQLQLDGYVPAGPADPLVGRTLGAYRIRERLGAGAVGVVYKAIQSGLEREVALKVLNPKAATPLTVASFKREAVAAGRLSHPNLVQVYDIGHEQGLHFFSMELVPGGNLESRLKEHGPLPWQEALGYARDCAEALAFALDHHLVHRDVKPENLMLTADGRAKLADLGMAATRGMLEQESAGGSPHFMAPESVAGAADHRSDLYSLGCTLYRLLTGATPFSGDTVKEILRAHRNEAVPDARKAVPEVPAEVAAFAARLMSKDPDGRPADARAAAEEISALLAPRRSPWPLVLLGLLAVGGAGVGIYFATRAPSGVAEPERVVEYRDRDLTPEEIAAREAMELERTFLLAMAEPEGAARRSALEAFLTAHPNSAYETRARDEIVRLDAVARQPVETADDPLLAMRAQLEQLGRAVDEDLARGAVGAARTRLAASGLPEQVRGPLDERVQRAAESALGGWEREHAEALARQDWAAATETRRLFAAAVHPGADAAPHADWNERHAALADAAAAAERAARVARFDAERRELLTALQGPVAEALLRCDGAAALAAFDAALEACGHEALREALAQERAAFVAAAVASQALRARLNGTEEVPVVEPVDGKRAFAVAATDAGVLVRVQIRGERVDQVLPWSAYRQPEAFLSLLRAVIPAEVADEASIALHLLFGQAALAAELRAQPMPERAASEARATSAAAWAESLPRSPAAPLAWAERHRAALFGLSEIYAALGADDAYLAWQRARQLNRDFSLLAAWCSDGSGAWQFQP